MSEASQPPTGTKLKAGHRPAAKASVYKTHNGVFLLVQNLMTNTNHNLNIFSFNVIRTFNTIHLKTQYGQTFLQDKQ